MKFVKVLVVTVCALAFASCTSSDTTRSSSDQQEIGGLPVTCGCDNVQPTDWDGRTRPTWYAVASSTSTDSTPIPVNNMQVIWTPSGDTSIPNQIYVWGIANGTHVAWVYRMHRLQFNAFMGMVLIEFGTVANNPSSRRFWGGGGGLGTGGPGPIGPIGFPPIYVARIIRTAGTMVDSQHVTIDAESPAPER